MISFEIFRQIFMANIAARSRTAKGDSSTSVSNTKRSLLLTGEDLRVRLTANLEKLVMEVWKWSRSTRLIDEYLLLSLFNDWFDIMSQGIIDFPGYEQVLTRVAHEHGWTPAQIANHNKRYRLWDVSYWDDKNPGILEVNETMRIFAHELAEEMAMIEQFPTTGRLAKALAYFDTMHDQYIHPWLDGCGRMSTVISMLICARAPGMPLPVTLEKGEHYRAMKNQFVFGKYYEGCLERGSQVIMS